MTDVDSKFDSYLKKLIELSERKMQIERATAAVYRAARRDARLDHGDAVSVERLKQAMKDRWAVLKDRNAKAMKADVEREKATIAPPGLKTYDDGLDLARFGIDSADVDDLIGSKAAQ